MTKSSKKVPVTESTKSKIKVIKQGEVCLDYIFVNENFSNGKDLLFLKVLSIFSTNLNFILAGDESIVIKFWEFEKDRPTIISTGLKWKTFHYDDDILILSKSKRFMTDDLIIYIGKKSGFKCCYLSERVKALTKKKK